MERQRIVCIGGGNMASSLVGGLVAAHYPVDRIAVAEPAQAQREALAQRFGVETGSDNRALAATADVVVLAVWAADGLSLRAGREEPGDPLVAATVSLIVALLLALVTATTGDGVSLPVLVALGGLAPSLFAAWSVVRLRGGFPAGHPRA
jgi:hypothetical protein